MLSLYTKYIFPLKTEAKVKPLGLERAKLYYTSFWDKFGMNINYFGMHPKT